jgi:hypothetical protein
MTLLICAISDGVAIPATGPAQTGAECGTLPRPALREYVVTLAWHDLLTKITKRGGSGPPDHLALSGLRNADGHLFCISGSPTCWISLSGDPADLVVLNTSTTLPASLDDSSFPDAREIVMHLGTADGT